MLLNMKNGGIKNIISDSWYSPGCETCDYGSNYINEFEIQLTTGVIKIEVDQMYEYALSDGYMMQLLLPNVEKIKGMDEAEFFDWLKEQMKDSGDSLKIEFVPTRQDGV
ncbi:hypothetical protein [Brevibacillus sp. NL20B1]|uniref:hypothetical protein n=1 Tax=Brevibacillus sp. NL20B1 TaxID=2829799 RepID=UPI001B9B3040|nr:hypothetical protein [Brevibacillus sp. NL20B1]MBR8661181.1 hypothetical protein [Brevibacillus sp. NL20B1]